ncbi:MAG: murein hydrolase activator EnvC family protein, partial [Sphingopyxis sp.]
MMLVPRPQFGRMAMAATAILACVAAWALVPGAAAFAVQDDAARAAPVAGARAAPQLVGDAVAQRITQERRELTRAQRQAVESEQRAQRMADQAERLSDGAARDRASLAALGLRIQAAEADLLAVRSQISILRQLQARQRARLSSQQRPIAQLLGALQLLTRRPPLTLFAQPGAARDLVHTRALIDAVLPQIRTRTAALRRDIARSRQLAIAQRRAAGQLTAGNKKLAERRAILARSEAQQRVRAASLASTAGMEGDRAIALGQDASDISALINRLDESSAVRDRLARLAGPVPRAGTVAPSGDAVAGVAPRPSQPAYHLPVVGTLLSGLGEVSSEGTRSRGMTIVTAPGAQVVAPADGRVVYAGAFRSYGRIVILDHGGGWTSLVTSMIAVSVNVGD